MAVSVRPARRTLLLAGLVLAALALRLWGIGFGRPLTSNYYVRPDESLVVEMALRGGGDPEFFFYPALMPLLSSLLFRLVHTGASMLPGATKGALAADAGLHLERFFLLARVVSTLAGTALVLAVERAASRLSTPRAGLLAAALVAVSPFAVREAHFAVTDTLLALTVGLVLALLAAPPLAARRLWLLASGAGLGLAASAKYPGAFLAPAVAYAVVSSSTRSRRLRDLALASSAAAAVFLAVNPYLVRHLAVLGETVLVLKAAIFERPASSGGWSIAEGVRNLARPLGWGPGLAFGPVLALLGLVAFFSGRPRRQAGVTGLLAMAGFGLPLFVAHVVPYRYALPLVPIVAVWAGVALDRASAEGASRGWRAASLAVASALILASLLLSIQLDRLLSRPDTRSLAGAFIRSRIPASCPVLFLGLPESEPQLSESVASLERRTAYVQRLYGPKAGEIISRLYRLEADARRAEPGRSAGYEVYRNEAPPRGERCLCIVAGGYPGFGSVPEGAEVSARVRRERTAERFLFSPFEGPDVRAPLEPADAFFLPMSGLFRLERPGPILEVEIVDGPPFD